MTKYETSLFADYHQFYIQDDTDVGIDGDTWDKESSERMLAVSRGVVAIGTARNMDVPVEIHLLDAPPEREFEDWDRVCECPLEVTSGRLVIAGCTDYFPDAMRIELAAGMYRVRVSYGGLDTISADGLDGDDRYRIELWPSTDQAITIVRPA
ncbi:MAG: hypothetical protein AAGL10_01295 [Pseudomonadota bacterium]